ncbi:MAG: alpha-L-rhamnosidase-related protein, partial [Planctomycetota bacterium]
MGEDQLPPLPRRLWWPWDEPVSRVTFRTGFAVEGGAPATLFICASGSYRAWVDGRELDPPDAHAPSWRIIHRLPVDLVAGEHQLAIEATPGEHGQPFVLACLDWPSQEVTNRVATDASWQMSTDSRSWRPAWAFDGVWAEPWGMPCNAPEDFCRLMHGWQVVQHQALSTIVARHEGATACGAAAAVRDDGRLALCPPTPFPAAPFPIEDVRAQDLSYRSREAHSHRLNHRLELFESRCPHVVFDVGAETFARMRLTVRSGGPAIIAVTTGESVPELHHHLGRVTDVFRIGDGESFATGPTGYRYVKVMVLGAAAPGTPVVLDPPEVQHILYPVEEAGSFSCSDERLDEIWRLGARTVHLCMQNEIWDGIKRDQLPWMGDLYTEALAVYHAFGDTRLARWSLGVLGELGPVPDRPLAQQRYPGLQRMWKQPDTDINGIPSYTLWWVVGLADYLLYSGDRTLIEDLAPELQATLRHVAGWVDDDGWWRRRSGWDYVDWSPLTSDERATFCHLLACQALATGADLLDAIGVDTQRFRELHERMAAAARRDLYVPAMLIRSGVLRPEEGRALFARTLADDPPWSMTYWHRYADLEAARLVGDVDWGVAYVRRHWESALELGHTSLWEAFDPAWIGPDPHAVSMIGAEHARYGGYETSLCHGWSAGPTAWLHRAILGVTPARPGFAEIEFRPHLADLAWAEGTIPTPHGPIRVRLDRADDGSVRPTVDVPAMLIRSGVLRPEEGRALFARTLADDPPWSMTYWHR